MDGVRDELGRGRVDLTIVGWLIWRRTRLPAYIVLVVFHVTTWLLFPIGMFPWIMIAGALIFFPPDWPHRFLSRLRKRPVSVAVHRVPAANHSGILFRAGAAALLLFALVQITLPLRHWAYPGNVRWNEDGYRFSWRVMLTEKTGFVRFRVTDAATGEQWLVYPEKYLTASTNRAHGVSAGHDSGHRAYSSLKMPRVWERNLQVRADVFVTFMADAHSDS